jgi:predicted AlkP superfamily phosphohydrolase/phosphomutase
MLIFSDHGFTDLKGAFYINEWLSPEYIHKKPVTKIGKKSMTEKLLTLANEMHLTAILKRFVSEKRRKKFQEKRRKEMLRRETFFIWEKTKVYCSSEGPVYINRDLVKDGEEYEALREKLIEELGKLVHPETGEKIVEKVYKKEEAYSGEYMTHAPDLVILPRIGYEISANVWDDGKIWANAVDFHSGWTGVHRIEGIFILNGPEIKEGAKFEGARIYDLAPTVLALKGLTIPDDMDGAILTDIMKDPEKYKNIGKREGKKKEEKDYEASEEDEEAIRKRLKSLGYM